MLRQLQLVALALMVGSSISCTSTTATRVKPDDFKTKGIRYWLAAPYLLVKEPVEVARTEEVFRYNAADNKLESLGDAQPVGGVALRKEIPLGANVLAANNANNQGFGTGANDDTKPADTDKDDDSKDDKDESDDKAKKEPTTAPTQKGSVELAWLPDYCHQYAVNQLTVLAKQTQKLSLGDGWRFVSFESTQDSTDIVGKVLDLAGTIVGARKDVKVAEIGAKAPKTGEEAQAGARIHLKKVTITYIPPGLYPLVKRDDCTAVPTIDINHLKYETRVEWTTMEVSQ